MEGSWKKKKTASGSLGKKREAISKRKNKNKNLLIEEEILCHSSLSKKEEGNGS